MQGGGGRVQRKKEEGDDKLKTTKVGQTNKRSLVQITYIIALYIKKKSAPSVNIAHSNANKKWLTQEGSQLSRHILRQLVHIHYNGQPITECNHP